MLSLDLTGKRAFVAGVGDNKGYGWAGVSDALSERPLRRSALMRALFTQIGMEPRQWCCAD